MMWLVLLIGVSAIIGDKSAFPDAAAPVVAPEVIELKGASTASDIWSLGCTVIELLTGKPPYAEIPNGLSGQYYVLAISLSRTIINVFCSDVSHCR